jgi:Isochorismatase family
MIVFLICCKSSMLRGKRSFASSMRCIVDTVQATTRLGSTLRPSRRQRGCERASNTARGVPRSAVNSNQPGDIVALEHWCSSGFANTDLDLQLKRHGIHKLIVIGLIAHTCVEATVRFAAELGYEVTMAKDATADYSDEEMHAAIDVNIPNYASAIVTAKELADSISSVKT